MDHATMLLQYRLRHKLTQRELAQKLQMSVTNLSRWENRTHGISPLWVEKLKEEGIINDGGR